MFVFPAQAEKSAQNLLVNLICVPPSLGCAVMLLMLLRLGMPGAPSSPLRVGVILDFHFILQVPIRQPRFH